MRPRHHSVGERGVEAAPCQNVTSVLSARKACRARQLSLDALLVGRRRLAAHAVNVVCPRLHQVPALYRTDRRADTRSLSCPVSRALAPSLRLHSEKQYIRPPSRGRSRAKTVWRHVVTLHTVKYLQKRHARKRPAFLCTFENHACSAHCWQGSQQIHCRQRQRDAMAHGWPSCARLERSITTRVDSNSLHVARRVSFVRVAVRIANSSPRSGVDVLSRRRATESADFCVMATQGGRLTFWNL